MKRNSELVRQFHQAIGSILPEKPTVPSKHTLLLYPTLITEEYQEVMRAFSQITSHQESGCDADIVPIVHELLDLLYITYGTLLLCGIEPDEAFLEIHRANLQKAGAPRRQDGKLIKPPNWSPPDVASVVKRQVERSNNKQA